MKIIALTLILVPSLTFASLKSLELEVSGTHFTIPPSCVKSVQIDENEEPVNNGVYFEIESPCSKQLSDLSIMNIGQQMTISYNGQLVQKATITSRLFGGFKFSTTGSNMMVIRQIIADWKSKPGNSNA
ncbi:hypothetical protein [Rahnella sikkimica]|uniref:Fimbrial protein n=1 Tax=Rahnella sikkimica TaxID=1805933 RepID=A0A2L1UPL9_9GAMM|nr:hypothetical protein [Rahnella sikkimica]AVF34879.1 hypothetical protein BV494_08000 [Rahnella sikkimica]